MNTKIISLILILFFAASTFAHETENNTELPSRESTADTTTLVNKDGTPFKRHTISVGYGILTLSDFYGMLGSVIVSMFDGDDPFGTLGALSIDYGYKIGEFFETGLVFNYAEPIKNTPLYTIMPRAKMNFNSTGFFNPFMEVDLGVSFNGDGVIPMFQLTLLGFEMGTTIPVIINILSFGQRGMFYGSIGFKF